MRFALLWFMAWEMPLTSHPDLREMRRYGDRWYGD